MKNLARFLLLCLLTAGLATASAQTPPKPGYNVIVEVSYDEKGTPEDVVIVESEDPTGDHMLEQITLNMVKQDIQPPRVVDGKPVKFKARRPYNFPVEGDEGPTVNPKPALHGQQVLPTYPEELAARGEIGGAIVELKIRSDGKVDSVRTLRASHPEFARAAEEAVKQWVFFPNDTPGAPSIRRWNAAIAFTLHGRNVDLKWRLAPRPSLGGFIRGRAEVAPAPVVPATVAPVPENK